MCVSIVTVSSPRHAHTRTHRTLAQTQRVPICEIGPHARRRERACSKQHLPARGGGAEAACTGVGTRFLGTVAPVQDRGTVTKVKLVRGAGLYLEAGGGHRTRCPVHGGDSRQVAPDSPDLASGRPQERRAAASEDAVLEALLLALLLLRELDSPARPRGCAPPMAAGGNRWGHGAALSLDGAGALSRVVTHPSSPTAHVKNGLHCSLLITS